MLQRSPEPRTTCDNEVFGTDRVNSGGGRTGRRRGYLRATNDDYWLVDEPNKNIRESVRRG
jgi:hypothetical protein